MAEKGFGPKMDQKGLKMEMFRIGLHVETLTSDRHWQKRLKSTNLFCFGNSLRQFCLGNPSKEAKVPPRRP